MNKIEKSRIRIVINDLPGAFREGIATIVKRNRHFELIGQFNDNAAMLRFISSHKTDVVLVSTQLVQEDLSNSIKSFAIKHTHVSLICISNLEDLHDVVESVNAGVKGLLTRSASVEEIQAAIKAVYSGENYWPMELLPRISKMLPRANQVPMPKIDTGLNKKERVFIKMLCRGYSPKEMSVHFGLHPRTIEAKKLALFTKLESKNIAQLMNYAIKNGLYNPYESKYADQFRTYEQKN